MVLIAGSGVCAKDTLAKQSRTKLEIKIDIVRTVLSLVSFESKHYLRPKKGLGCKNFRLLRQMTALEWIDVQNIMFINAASFGRPHAARPFRPPWRQTFVAVPASTGRES